VNGLRSKDRDTSGRKVVEIALVGREDREGDFSEYTCALLAMEGLRAERVTLEGLNVSTLPDRIVLGSDLPLTAAEVAALQARAEAGARLIFLAPAPYVAEAFGFAPTYHAEVDGFLRLRRAGFPIAPLQFHALLRHLIPPPEAEILAEACDDTPDHLSTGAPALVRLLVGAGEAIFFFYDLPRSIALTRQGDPRRAGLHGNHVAPGWRAADMFAGFLASECAALPQADLQCHLLRDLLCAPLRTSEPGLPFFWYFPDDAPTVLLLSSDDDWSTPEQFAALNDCLQRHQAQMTYYLVEDTCVTPEQMQAWCAQGMTFSIHPNHHEPLPRTWNTTIQRHREAFRARFGVEPGPSVRNHAIPWIGYVEGARLNQACGFLWDTNFFTCPPETRFYMTGGGLPLPFVSITGEMIPVWQMPAQFSDETTLAAGGFPFSLHYSEAEGIEVVGALLRANAEGLHSLVCINTHPVSFATYSGGMWDAVLAESVYHGIPRLSLDGFAAFWERRDKITVHALRDGDPTWEVTIPEASPDVSLLIALPAGATLTWDHQHVPVARRWVHNVEYASVRLPNAAGTYTLSIHR
jgi:hypothetical protein